MGRPIHNKNFGATTADGRQITFTSAWIPGEESANATSIILNQVGTHAFLAKNTATDATGVVYLGTSVAAAGQALITVLVDGPGSGATATARLRAKTLTIGDAGTGYAPADTVTLVGGTSTTAVVATVATVDGGGGITGLTLTTPGLYSVLTSGAVATTTSGSGVDATVSVSEWELGSVVVGAGGTLYSSATVAFSSGAATATATVDAGVVTGVTVGARGSYTAMPTVTIVPGDIGGGSLMKIMSTKVVTFEGGYYNWVDDGSRPDSTYCTVPGL